MDLRSKHPQSLHGPTRLCPSCLTRVRLILWRPCLQKIQYLISLIVYNPSHFLEGGVKILQIVPTLFYLLHSNLMASYLIQIYYKQ